MFHNLDFPRLFLCESTGYSKHKTTGIAPVAILWWVKSYIDWTI